MESLQGEDGQYFIKSLAQFIRHHEKALANSLQLPSPRRQTGSSETSPVTCESASSNNQGPLASALSLARLTFLSPSIKPAFLTLTPHHLFYLLSCIDDLGINVGPMNIRIESIHSEPSHSNYVSFLQAPGSKRHRGDSGSIHSVSSVRSVMSNMTAFWSSIGLGITTSKSDKAKAVVETDLKYLYSAFTKLPSLRLTSDPRARLIKGYEEFPFDTAVPLFAFKNLQQLDIVDMDFRQFQGWDRLADQLCLLTVKRGNLDDLEDLLTNIVLDDAEKRRRRSTRNHADIPSTPSWTVPSTPGTSQGPFGRSLSDSGSPSEGSPRPGLEREQGDSPPHNKVLVNSTTGSGSPKRPTSSRPSSSYRSVRAYSSRLRRTDSGSSNSSDWGTVPHRRDSFGNLLNDVLPMSKWQRLKYLSLADNALTALSGKSLNPLTTTLRSLNLSSNLFNEVPESLALLTRLTSLDLSNCMIDSLLSLTRTSLPAITTLKMKSNRLSSLSGIERLMSLECLHIQDNLLADPAEAARLTGLPNMKKLWVRRNPFTKRYSDYRTTIMNLFRQTPGYLDDILVDGTSASYMERKHLVARVPELERPSRTPQIQIAEPPVIVQHSRMRSRERSSSRGHEGEVVVLQPGVSNAGMHRKRGARRHIVDLAAGEQDRSAQQGETSPSLTLNTQVHAEPDTRDNSSKPPQSSSVNDESVTKVDTDTNISQSAENVESNKGPDARRDDYKAHIEALRRKFGADWLHALEEQNFHSDNHLGPHTRATFTSLPGPVAQTVVAGSRSLG